MCIGVWTLKHPEYALILGSNRDEFLSRPTVDAAWHSFGQKTDKPFVISGLDVLAGGTWLGINRRGDVAMLTNITEYYQGPHLDSRGDLAREYLMRPASQSMREWAKELVTSHHRYAGFNLLLLSFKDRSASSLEYDSIALTNLGAGGEIRIRDDRGGNFGEGMKVEAQSNAVWPDRWNKVSEAEDRMITLKGLQGCRDSQQLSDGDALKFMKGILDWRPREAPVTRSQLRTTILVKPLPIGAKRQMYATRDHTVILVHRDGRVSYIEQDVYVEENGVILDKRSETLPLQYEFTVDRN